MLGQGGRLEESAAPRGGIPPVPRAPVEERVVLDFALGVDERPRITVTSARTATASLVAQGRGRRPTGGAPGALAGAVGHGTTGRAPPPIEAASRR
ncbi:hypothetical protein EMIHUDRAFT_362423 [Emiliania huxleyi CCMP1516]|uniref:Uncharacterized protein n=2 Tax=Emiliania huxleyi TaxID=2903 RepID=A0A0D3KL52_EMIH1|nr:hypothetical protein EMIHUDRAFT_362423 [Emiliania huxleyi CCMP1516]EOD36487.1 hypothetical protein EMIHUDRAFT_362423 [Emiliania huxleyi CCMP1516]|eukprot:XP_005788916.1 hypothetical protein EMIHUDRAFT_362423 [Emiliania huxleyi CCMP1516]